MICKRTKMSGFFICQYLMVSVIPNAPSRDRTLAFRILSKAVCGIEGIQQQSRVRNSVALEQFECKCSATTMERKAFAEPSILQIDAYCWIEFDSLVVMRSTDLIRLFFTTNGGLSVTLHLMIFLLEHATRRKTTYCGKQFALLVAHCLEAIEL